MHSASSAQAGLGAPTATGSSAEGAWGGSTWRCGNQSSQRGRYQLRWPSKLKVLGRMTRRRCPDGPAPACGGRLLDRADLGAGEVGVDEELERGELLGLLREAGEDGAAQPGQGAAGGVAQQARLDDLQREAVIALADEGGRGGGELLFPA